MLSDRQMIVSYLTNKMNMHLIATFPKTKIEVYKNRNNFNNQLLFLCSNNIIRVGKSFKQSKFNPVIADLIIQDYIETM